VPQTHGEHPQHRFFVLRDSTCIALICYTETSQQMHVQFRDGDVVRYDGVPPQVVASIVVATHPGKVFDVLVRKNPEVYPFEYCPELRGATKVVIDPVAPREWT
jgi:hypothetical protein